MTRSFHSVSRLWLPPLSLLVLLLGVCLLAQAQSNATPAIRLGRTDGPKTDPTTATTVLNGDIGANLLTVSVSAHPQCVSQHTEFYGSPTF